MMLESRESVEKWLQDYNVKDFTIDRDLNVDVYGDVNIKSRGLIEIPIRFRFVSGSFVCGFNKLTSLIGCPVDVGGNFICKENLLVSLDGCPVSVGGDFKCIRNELTNLNGCPISVGGNSVNPDLVLRG